MDQTQALTRLVQRLKQSGYISSQRVEDAMLRVPRHLFLPEAMREQAYLDAPLHIGEGQTISAPHMVALMAEALDLRPGHKVLEVGGGSGYHAAVMAELVRPDGRIFSMERIASLARTMRANLERSGYSGQVEVVEGDGTKGLPQHAPFHRISVAAAAPRVPDPLKEQLADGGRLLIPVGGPWYQELLRITRRKDRFTSENLGGCAFVPLVGEHGNP